MSGQNVSLYAKINVGFLPTCQLLLCVYHYILCSCGKSADTKLAYNLELYPEKGCLRNVASNPSDCIFTSL